MTASTHLISGWYDIFLREQLDDYKKLRANGQTPYLTIGPWHHLDSQCLLESIRQSLVWFDVNLKGERHQLRAKPVLLYVMGAGGWHELDSWPPPSTETRYYLHRHDDAQTTTDPGLSSEMPLEPLPADRYTYDPDDPTPSIGGPVMSVSAGRVDNTGLESRSDVLTYTSALLEESLEVIGNVSLRLFTKSSVEHCDYFARLLDVHPDGKSINICDGLARVKPGSGGLLPDGSRMIEIDMWATAVKFQVGHRIRLMVSSGAHPRYYRNLGTDESLTTTTMIVPSEHSIYHDPDHRSCLLLPVTSS